MAKLAFPVIVVVPATWRLYLVRDTPSTVIIHNLFLSVTRNRCWEYISCLPHHGGLLIGEKVRFGSGSLVSSYASLLTKCTFSSYPCGILAYREVD